MDGIDRLEARPEVFCSMVFSWRSSTYCGEILGMATLLRGRRRDGAATRARGRRDRAIEAMLMIFKLLRLDWKC